MDSAVPSNARARRAGDGAAKDPSGRAGQAGDTLTPDSRTNAPQPDQHHRECRTADPGSLIEPESLTGALPADPEGAADLGPVRAVGTLALDVLRDVAFDVQEGLAGGLAVGGELPEGFAKVGSAGEPWARLGHRGIGPVYHFARPDDGALRRPLLLESLALAHRSLRGRVSLVS